MPLNFMRRLSGRHRTPRANKQLGGFLALIAGAVNAGGFLAVHQYTSHMSGFVSSVADNLVLGNMLLMLAGLGSILSFLAGAACTAVLINWARHRDLQAEYALSLVAEAVLLLLFNNALQPLTILIAVPLCAGGAFGMLLLTNNYLSLPALIGLLMLIGIATKNSILLVDYAVIAEKTLGLSRHEALIDACHKRARPVIMTTLAMGAGMLPIALGFVADSSFRAPMAITVIGGLLTSTVLSLVVVPAAFTLVDDVETWLLRKMGRSGQAA